MAINTPKNKPGKKADVNIASLDETARINTSAFDEAPELQVIEGGRYLADHHREMLETGSSISPPLIEQRGYFTALQPQELKAIGFSDVQSELVPALVIPLYGVDGDVVGYQSRPDKPRIKAGKAIKYETPAGWAMRLDVSPVSRKTLLDPREPLWITEGAKKADSAAIRGLCCIDLIGVWNFRGANEYGGIAELADWDRIPLKSKDIGRTVYIVYDNDILTKPSVRAAMIRLARILRRKGAGLVHAVVIPSKLGGKTGLDDYFAAGGNVSELRDSIQDELLENTAIIINNRSLAEVTNDSLKALVAANHPPQMFVRSGSLVRVVEDENGAATIQDLSEHALRGILARCARFIQKRKEDVEVSPPREVVMDVLSLAHWPDIPPLVNVIGAPVLAYDGTLSMEPGYCSKSKVYINSKESWPEFSGSAKDAAYFLLNEFLCDFPFATEADRAHVLALMVLPIVRAIIRGPTPLHLVDAPAPATGKSKLCNVCLIPTMGPNISTTGGTKDEEEWRKKIGSSLRSGRAYIFLDNLSRKVDNETLASALTSQVWTDRIMGVSNDMDAPVRCIWLASSNNAELGYEILRRTVWIRLDAGVEQPEKRTGFKHPRIEEWTRANRGVIVSALCRLVSSWVSEGRPLFYTRKIASYDEWSEIVGGILQVADVPGFLGNSEQFRESADTDANAWAAFYRRWFERFEEMSAKAGELREIFEQDDDLRGKLGDKNEASRTTRLGHFLKRRVGVIAGGLKVERANKYGNSICYRLVAVTPQDTTAQNPLAAKPQSRTERIQELIEEAEL